MVAVVVVVEALLQGRDGQDDRAPGMGLARASLLVGSLIGALGGGALGAFAGAYLGEVWVGKTPNESFAVGQGAFVGRLLGTIGKLAIGAVMVVVVAVDIFT